MTKISILGCGWLGLPLAKALIGNGFSVKGSTTSYEKISGLEQGGITTFLIPDFSINGRIFSILETNFSEEFPLNLGGILIIKTWLCSKN